MLVDAGLVSDGDHPPTTTWVTTVPSGCVGMFAVHRSPLAGFVMSMSAAVPPRGAQVSVAFDGPRGLEAAEAEPPEVIVCDIGLPGMDGYQVAQALRCSTG